MAGTDVRAGEIPSPGHAGAPLHPNEIQRLQTLCALGILDTPPRERFDRLTRLACRLFEVPIALVSLVDSDRQWFKARVGLDAHETPREHSFCAHAILEDEILLVSDATKDPRFKSNPLVLGPPHIRFYAGCPIKAPNGLPLGTLCVIGPEPRQVSAEDLDLLRDLAHLVEQELEALSLATVDDLTGLTNRRGLDAVAQYVLNFCDRLERPATVLVFDLDGFKSINDTHGHAAGDRVLQGFSHALLATFRNSDVVARLGGDEFCVLMSGANETDAQRPLDELAARLRDGIGPHTEVSFTVGVATSDGAGRKTLSTLLDEADRLMYAGKRASA